MKTIKLSENILLFTFKTQKELALTFFRVQEYYESPYAKLHGKEFSVFDFLNTMMNEKGEIDYFAKWCGFNIPGSVINDWVESQQDFDNLSISHLTHAERNLCVEIYKNISSKNEFYVIGALEKDSSTIDHEIAHALYSLNDEYRENMENLNRKFRKEFPKIYNSMSSHLKKMQYRSEVIKDEIQAYLSSESKKYLGEEFDFDWNAKSKNKKSYKFNDLRIEYRKTLRKYNTFKWQ